MHMIRLGLAALFCACVGAAGAQEPPAAPGTSEIVLQLSDLEFDAYSLDPLGGTAAAGLLGQEYRAAAEVLGTREQFSMVHAGAGPVSAYALGDSTRMEYASSIFIDWNRYSDATDYAFDAHARLRDPLSQWYLAEGTASWSATIHLTPNSVLVVSGHLFGTQEVGAGAPFGATAGGFFDIGLEGAGAATAYTRSFGSDSAQPGIDESFSLSIFNRSDTAKDFSWSVVAGASAAKAIPPVPEPSALAMTLCGLLLLAMRHAACAQRR
ncbi:hypothetical protein ACN9MU_17150 [Pseudoduganella sp. R-32]|uniref:hypothetical protein n=1 Tax=unclassified Pseudoduganella TaxID=2637179 RepID=UPI003CEAEC59